MKLKLQGGYLEAVPGMAFSLCTINASVAAFSTQSAAVLVRLQQDCKMKVTCLLAIFALLNSQIYSPPSTAEVEKGETTPSLPHMALWHSA
jgi:hypothetical protein